MPKKKGQTRRKGPHGRGKIRDQGTVTTINRMPTPWSTRFRTTLKYTDEFDITLTSNTLSTYVFNSNGLYDPDQTGVGHQYLGFDQFSPLYSRYRVLAIEPNITFGNVATNGAAVRCAVKHVNGSSIPTRPAIFEVGFGKSGVVGPYGAPLKIRNKFDLTRLNADPQKYRIDDRYAATMTTNPAEVMYVVLAVFPNVSSTMRICVEFTTHVEFYDPETPGASVDGTTVDAVRKKFKVDASRVLN